jgi:hypothetical protein
MSRDTIGKRAWERDYKLSSEGREPPTTNYWTGSFHSPTEKAQKEKLVWAFLCKNKPLIASGEKESWDKYFKAKEKFLEEYGTSVETYNDLARLFIYIKPSRMPAAVAAG